MAICILTCDCGSAEGLVRQALHRYEYKNWAMEPIFKGKGNSLQSVENLLRMYPENAPLQALFAHINGSSKWAVILGHNNTEVKWADISHNDMKSDIEAEYIIANFS